LCNPRRNRRARARARARTSRPRASTLYLPAVSRHPTTWRDKRTADTIIYFANALQNCRYSFSVQSIQFSAPRVRSDGRARARAALCSRAMVLSFRDRHDRADDDNAISRR